MRGLLVHPVCVGYEIRGSGFPVCRSCSPVFSLCVIDSVRFLIIGVSVD